jgi:hypothetical protein
VSYTHLERAGLHERLNHVFEDVFHMFFEKLCIFGTLLVLNTKVGKLS